MPNDKAPDGFPVFANKKDIELMNEIKMAYIESFQKSTGIEEEHKKVPDIINITTNYHESKIPLFPKFLVGYVKKQLLVSELRLKYFADSSEIYSNRVSYGLTFDLISSGILYIDETENDFSRRKGWDAFSSIHRPEYYLIFMISSKAKELCKLISSNSLLIEYECFQKFIGRVINLLNIYFPSHADVHPFHHYLFGASNYLKEIKKRVEFELKRISIVRSLEEISNSLEAYRREMAIYLAYCLSSAEIRSISLNQLSNDSRGLPSEFSDSIIYKNIRSALSGNMINCQLKPSDAGVSKLLFKKIPRNQSNKVLNFYQKLLNALSQITRLSKNIYFLKDNTELHGSYKVVHDKELHLTLIINMDIIKFFLVECKERMNYINSQNNLSLFGHENFKLGTTNNIKEAEEQSNNLQKIEDSVTAQQAHISNRIIEIENLNPEVLKEGRSELILSTKKILTFMAENGTIPQTKIDDLQNKLFSSSPASKEDSGVEILAEKNEMFKPKKPIERTYSFANQLYDYLEDYPEKILKFNALIASLDEERACLENFVIKLEKINQLRTDLENKLQNNSEQAELEKIFLNLQKECNDATYSGKKFVSFSFLNHIKTIYSNRKKSSIQNVRNFLESIKKPEKNEIHHQSVNQIDRLIMIVTNHFTRSASNTIKRIQNLKACFDPNQELYQANLIEYFSKKIGHIDPILGTDALLSQQQVPKIEPILSQKLTPDSPQSLSSLFNHGEINKELLELNNICKTLFDENKTMDELKNSLKIFRDFLFNFSYKLHFFGGSWVQDRKVSKHAKRAIAIYDSKIKHAATLNSLKKIRDNMFKMIAPQASKHSSQSCCLFNLRDNSTQNLYDLIESAIPANERQLLLK